MQYQNEVNDIRAERIAKSENPLALLAAAQPYSDNYYQAPKPQKKTTSSSSTRPSASTRHKGKEIAKPVTPQSESLAYTDEEIDDEQELEHITVSWQDDRAYQKKPVQLNSHWNRTNSNELESP
ncbi:hypothetical protein Tco_0151693 [Tanacetum coccineum]